MWKEIKYSESANSGVSTVKIDLEGFKDDNST